MGAILSSSEGTYHGHQLILKLSHCLGGLFDNGNICMCICCVYGPLPTRCSYIYMSTQWYFLIVRHHSLSLTSYKFGRKVTYINRLEELKPILFLERLDIPDEVKR